MRVPLKMIQNFLYGIGTLSAVYGLIVLAIIGTGHWFNYFFLAAGAAAFSAGYLLKYIAGCGKWGMPVLWVLCAAICLCTCNFTVFECKAIATGVRGEHVSAENMEKQPQWVIVLGAKVNSDLNPKLEFARRLQRAEELCTEHTALILTGGQGADEPVSEARGAYTYLVSRNRFRAGMVYLEDKSTSTAENLENALAIIKENGGSAEDRVLIISSGFHLYRASGIAARAGFTNTAYAGSRGLVVMLPYYYVREYAACMRDVFSYRYGI